ncbi:hypothetical protein GQ55_9G233900 [Panicum hallii var. hallii]|uniref:Uncharacterized protein n=1 Tax=Panicum hallii var. hallii TaxID=1504633 RepID=A0A2T7C6Q4_9POAL|nr:hypothetical protein GQ55_9G233900 [Panicum hallii var. hallii]
MRTSSMSCSAGPRSTEGLQRTVAWRALPVHGRVSAVEGLQRTEGSQRRKGCNAQKGVCGGRALPAQAWLHVRSERSGLAQRPRGGAAAARGGRVALWARSRPGLCSGSGMRCCKRRAGLGFVRLARAPASAWRYGRSGPSPNKGRRGQFFFVFKSVTTGS